MIPPSSPVYGHGRLRDVARSTGQSVGFAGQYVHDVRNAGGAPAVSVHVYSPPLTSMTFYDLADGELVRLADVPTDDPEVEFDVREAS